MYGAFKDYILRSFDTNPQVLHVVLGLAFYGLSLILSRRPWFSLIVVFCVQGANEVLDAREDLGRGRGLSMQEIFTDTVWTVALQMLATASITLFHSMTKDRLRC